MKNNSYLQLKYAITLLETPDNIFDTINIYKVLRALLVFSCLVPAVDDHGPNVGIFSLFSVDLSEEAEDAAWLLGDTMVRPAQVLVVPDGTRMFGL